MLYLGLLVEREAGFGDGSSFFRKDAFRSKGMRYAVPARKKDSLRNRIAVFRLGGATVCTPCLRER